jgi:hypothetical protein
VKEAYLRFDDIDIDLSMLRLEKQLRTHKELSNVRMPHSTLEDLEARRNRRNAYTGQLHGVDHKPGESEAHQASRHADYVPRRRQNMGRGRKAGESAQQQAARLDRTLRSLAKGEEAFKRREKAKIASGELKEDYL